MMDLYLGMAATLAALVGAVIAAVRAIIQHERADIWEEADPSGWVYFVQAVGQPDSPVKVGMTYRDPTEDRLPELRTMSPYPLRIIYKFHTEDRHQYEAKLHRILKPHRRHGEWYDRDATLALIDHLKGASA